MTLSPPRFLWKKSKRAQVSIYLAFIIVSIMIVFIAAFFAPMGVLLNTELYSAGEDIMLQANDSIQSINDASVRAAVQGVWDESFAAQQNNIEINADIFQYSWIFIIGLSAVVVFLFTRTLIEYGSFGNRGFV